jgi:hypothetical protein
MLGLQSSSISTTFRRRTTGPCGLATRDTSDGPPRLVERLVDSDYWSKVPVEGALPEVYIETYLPHLTIGIMKGENDPAPLREALIPLRDLGLGKHRVSEARLCLIPASRTTILNPWKVGGFVALA